MSIDPSIDRLSNASSTETENGDCTGSEDGAEYMQMKDDDAGNSNLIETIYEAIAKCFIFGDDYDEMQLKLQHWICNKCSNCNINAIMNGITTDINTCRLCGTSQTDQIILKLRNRDTYMTVHDVHKDRDPKPNAMDGDIEASIKDAMSADESFDLHCPNQNNNNEPCASILRLAKMLIIYKRWLQRIYRNGAGNDDIAQTIKVDVSVYIDNDTFKGA
eukprot:291681_1